MAAADADGPKLGLIETSSELEKPLNLDKLLSTLYFGSIVETDSLRQTREQIIRKQYCYDISLLQVITWR